MDPRESGTTLRASDLAQLHFNVNGPEMVPRETVEVSLITSGATVRADFRAPASFGNDTIITLR